MITHKRFPTVGGNGKVVEPSRSTPPARTFGTVKAEIPSKPASRSVSSTVNKPPFDLDGTERVSPSNDVGVTTVPPLRRAPRPSAEPVKPKAKPKAIKPVTPLSTLKDSTAPTPKPELAKRNPKAKVEVTAPIKATADLRGNRKALADALNESFLAKADKALAKSAPVKTAVKELTAVRSTTVKPGKIADKAKYDQAKKAGIITEVASKAKVTKKSTSIKPAKTVKAPVTKIENSTPAGVKAKTNTKVFNKASKTKK